MVGGVLVGGGGGVGPVPATTIVKAGRLADALPSETVTTMPP